MNLRKVANRMIQTVNHNVDIQWLRSNGFTTNAAGKMVPLYDTHYVKAQIQAMGAGDLKHMEALNVTGIARSVFMYGNVQGVVRADGRGGDLLCFPEVPNGDNKTWLITAVVETWPDWVHVIVTLQDDQKWL